MVSASWGVWGLVALVVVLSLGTVVLVCLSLWRQVKDLGRAVGAAADRLGAGTDQLEAAQQPGDAGRPPPVSLTDARRT